MLLTHLGKTPCQCSALVPVGTSYSSTNQLHKLLWRHLRSANANSCCALSEENICLVFNALTEQDAEGKKISAHKPH